MKVFFVGLAACLFLVAHCAVLPVDVVREQENAQQIIDELRQQAEQHKAHILERLYGQVPLQQIQQTDTVVKAIETRGKTSSVCYAGIEPVLQMIVEQMFTEKQMCQVQTHKEAEDIILNVGIVIDEIIMDAYELTLLYKQCDSYTNSVDRGFCFTHWAFEIFNCIDNLRLTITDMVNSSAAKADALMIQHEMCTQNAIDSAVGQLQALYATFDTCETK